MTERALDVPTVADSHGHLAKIAVHDDAFSARRILSRHRGENFPVVASWLPGSAPRALLAVYGFARLVDELGDAAPGDRKALLDEVSRTLREGARDAGAHPILRGFAEVARRHAIPIDVAERLVEANRREQAFADIDDFEALLTSCEGTANPIGEMVLYLFGQAGPRNVALSNAVCSALQIVEHCQDVREDAQRGRVYLPADDLARAACTRADLLAAPAPEALRRVVALQVDRARRLLAEADALVSRLGGAARFLVAGYAAGGLATCDALARADFDVTSSERAPRRRDVGRHWMALLLRARRLR